MNIFFVFSIIFANELVQIVEISAMKTMTFLPNIVNTMVAGELMIPGARAPAVMRFT